MHPEVNEQSPSPFLFLIITVSLFYAYFLPFGPFFTLLAPLPSIITYLRFGRGVAFHILFASLILVGLMPPLFVGREAIGFGLINAGVFITFVIVPSLFSSGALLRGYGIHEIVTILLVSLIVLESALFSLLWVLYGDPPFQQWVSGSETLLASAMAIFQTGEDQVTELLEQAIHLVEWHYPVIVWIITIVAALVNSWVFVKLNQRKGYVPIHDFTESRFANLQLPRAVFPVFAFSLFFVFFQVQYLTFIATNVHRLLLFLCFLQGLAILLAIFRRHHIHRILWLVSLFLVFFQPYFYIVSTLGIIDFFFDFRGVRTKAALTAPISKASNP